MESKFTSTFPGKKRNWLGGSLLWLSFFLLYTLTAAPSIVELYDDSLEFQLVGPTFGIAHPTGYPLYVLLGGLWSRLLFPFGNWAWRMNLFSALAAATTLTLLFYLTQQLITQSCREQRNHNRIWPSLAAALAFGLGPVWWSQATVAEVYTLHNLLVAASLLVAWRIATLPTTDRGGRAAHQFVTLLACLLGLGLTHHRTIVLLGPGLLIMLWGQRWIWRPSWRWAGWLGALLAPLLLYLWIPLRAAMGVCDLNQSYINSWSGFWDHVLARSYTGFFEQNALTVQRTWSDWGALWLAQVGWVGLGLGLLGLFWVMRQGRLHRGWLGIIVVLLTNLLFTLTYRVGDQEVFLLPAWFCFALLTGAGMAALQPVAARWPVVQQAVALIGCLLLIAGLGRGPAVNRSQEWAAHDYAVALATVDFPPDSRVIALEGQATALRYMQRAVGLGRNAQPVIADTPSARLAAVEGMVEAGFPTYLTQEVDGLADRYSFSGEGPLVRVWPRGMVQLGPPRSPLAQPFADGALWLEGYDLDQLAEAGGPALRVALYWRPTTVLQQVYKLSLRVVDSSGAIVAWPDGHPVVEDRFPLQLAAPTTNWLPGETLRDVYTFKVPASALTPDHRLRLILYDAESVAEAGMVELPIQ